MGKNQAHKAMQRSRGGSTSTAPEDLEDGMVDGSFHSPEWHAARLASLKTSHTVTWEEFKKKKKEEEMRNGELEADTDRMMREYRAQLDAERSHKLSHGKNRISSKSSYKKGNESDKREKDSKKHRSKKRKHSRRSSDSCSSSLSETSSSDDDEKESKRSKSRLKRKRKEKRHHSRSKHPTNENTEADGPLPLSRFFQNVKN